MNLLGAFREVAPHAADLPSLVARLDDSVRRHQARVGGSPGAFITATIVSIPPGPVAYLVCCGHPGPLVIRAGNVYEMQASRPSLPLGLGDLSPGDYRVDAFSTDSPSWPPMFAGSSNDAGLDSSAELPRPSDTRGRCGRRPGTGQCG